MEGFIQDVFFWSSFFHSTLFLLFSHIAVEKAMAPTPVLLPGKFHGQRSLVGSSPWGRKESDTTERLHSLSLQGTGMQKQEVKKHLEEQANLALEYGMKQGKR